jgi:hypothetical protein
MFLLVSDSPGMELDGRLHQRLDLTRRERLPCEVPAIFIREAIDLRLRKVSTQCGAVASVGSVPHAERDPLVVRSEELRVFREDWHPLLLACGTSKLLGPDRAPQTRERIRPQDLDRGQNVCQSSTVLQIRRRVGSHVLVTFNVRAKSRVSDETTHDPGTRDWSSGFGRRLHDSRFCSSPASFVFLESGRQRQDARPGLRRKRLAADRA